MYGLPTSAIGSRTFHYGGRSRNYSAMHCVCESPHISSALGRVIRWRVRANNKITSDAYVGGLTPWDFIYSTMYHNRPRISREVSFAANALLGNAGASQRRLTPNWRTTDVNTIAIPLRTEYPGSNERVRMLETSRSSLRAARVGSHSLRKGGRWKSSSRQSSRCSRRWLTTNSEKSRNRWRRAATRGADNAQQRRGWVATLLAKSSSIFLCDRLRRHLSSGWQIE